jgi:hypothetical protein
LAHVLDETGGSAGTSFVAPAFVSHLILVGGTYAFGMLVAQFTQLGLVQANGFETKPEILT